MIKFSRSALAGLEIPDEAKAFLERIGLPEDSAGLQFHFEGSVVTMAEELGIEADDLDEDSVGLVNLPVIGRSEGDQICLDPAGRVLLVNHDDFSDAQVINSSLPRMADCLAAFAVYRKATGQLAEMPDDAAAWRAALGEAASRLRAIDPDAYGEFWHARLKSALVPLGFDIKHVELGMELASVIAP